MGDRIFRAALTIVLSILVQLLVKNVFHLRLRHDAKLLQCISQRCGTRIEAPVALALPFSSPPSVSLKKERNGEKSGEEIKPNKSEGANLSSQLSNFLASGTQPIVFTQGSTAVHSPGDFYKVSAAAAKRLGRRAVLLGNKAGSEVDSPDLLTLSYAPYSQLFPRAVVNVHQGGSGTTGEALRSGRPMLIVPYGWDQPDNAVRVQRLGAGLHLARTEYSVETATTALKALLDTSRFSLRATAVGEQMATEDGLALACDAIDSVLEYSDSLPQQRSSQRSSTPRIASDAP